MPRLVRGIHAFILLVVVRKTPGGWGKLCHSPNHAWLRPSFIALRRMTVNDPNAKLRRDFDSALHSAYLTAKSFGYNATEFFHMLTTMRGVMTAKTLINKPRSPGYVRLWQMNRLNLTVEAVVVDNPQFHCLFDPLEIDRARNRLLENGYTPKN